jgi:hypothetical protein
LSARRSLNRRGRGGSYARGAWPRTGSLGQFPPTIAGEEVEVLHVGQGNRRRELIATCQRAGRQFEIALLDIDIHADPATSRLLAAQQWIAANVKQIQDLGPEPYLRNLLSILKGDYPKAPSGTPRPSSRAETRNRARRPESWPRAWRVTLGAFRRLVLDWCDDGLVHWQYGRLGLCLLQLPRRSS